MRRRVTEDTPSYAAETIRSAQVSGSHLAASSGLFLLLLAGMSLVEAPIPASALPALAQVGSEASSKRAANTVHWCLQSRAPELLIPKPGGAAHPRAG
jgi:hypothetical protein